MTPDQIFDGYRRANAFVPIPQDQTNLDNVAAQPKTNEEVQAEVKTAYSNFIPMVTNRMGTNYVPVAASMLANVETNVLSTLTNSAMREAGMAAKF